MKIIIEIKDGMTLGDGKDLTDFLKDRKWCERWHVDFEEDKDNDKKTV